MATHSSILDWKTPWMEELGRLQSMGSQRVGHDWETSLHFTSLHFTWNLGKNDLKKQSSAVDVWVYTIYNLSKYNHIFHGFCQ